MAILHGLALFLLCLVGYAGAVVGSTSGDRPPPPRPSGGELLLTAALGFIAAGGAPDVAGHWLAFPVAVGLGAAAGGVTGLLRRLRGDALAATGPTVTPIYRRSPAATGSDTGGVRGFLLRVGDFQGHVTMGYLYYALLAPFALISHFLQSPLDPESREESFWSTRSAPDARGDSLTHQY